MSVEDDLYLFARAQFPWSREDLLALPAPLRWGHRDRLKKDLKDEHDRANAK